MLLGATSTLVGCDIVAFATDPKPSWLETWDLPTSSTGIAVGTILPDGVTIYSTPASNPPDSSAFKIDIDDITFSQRLGTDCTACGPVSGTNTIKPAFRLAKGSSSALPADMVSGAVTGGTLMYTITNGLSFDPIRVSTTPGNPQGYLTLLLHSGSLVLGKDSLNGATTAMGPGAIITGSIAVNSGTVEGPITLDLVLESPQGDHNVFINANGTVSVSATLEDAAGNSTFRTTNVKINVTNRTMVADAPTELPQDIDEGIADRVERGVLRMTVDNPFAISGTLDAVFSWSPEPSSDILKPFPLPEVPGEQVQEMEFDGDEIANILSGTPTTFQLTGVVNSLTPITVTPKQHVSISSRMLLTVRIGELE